MIRRYSRSYLVAVPVSLCVFLNPLLDSLGMLQATVAGFHIEQLVRGSLLVLMLANIALHSGRSARPPVHRIILPLIWLPLYEFMLFAVRDIPLALNIGYVLRYLFLVAIFYNVILSARTGAITERWLQYAAWCALCLAVAGQIAGIWLAPPAVGGGYESALSGLTIGPGIVAAGLLSLLPAFLYLGKRPGLGYLGLTLCTIALVASFRRSGILAAGVGLAIYLVLWSVRANAKRLRPVLLALGSVAALAGALSGTSVARGLIVRFEDLDISRGGTGSGRTHIWPVILEHIEQREFGQQLLGEGPLVAVALTSEKLNLVKGIGTHDDWLNVLMAAGLVGTSLQIWFFVNIFTLARRLLRVEPRIGIACFSTLGMMIFLSATTGGVFDPTMAPLYAFIGYAAFELQRCPSPRRGDLVIQLRRQLGITNRSVPWPQINRQTET